MSDTASTEKSKSNYLKTSKDCAENADKTKKSYDELNASSFKDIQEMALDETEDRYDEASAHSRKMSLIFYLFLLCIPLYIFADRPYGYVESRYRTESRVLGGIRKIGYAIAGFLAGSALATQYLSDYTVKTTYSDGTTSTHKEFDVANIFVIAMKVAMYVAALIIVCGMSCFIMVYSTVTGLKRNYDWQPLLNAIKSKLNRGTTSDVQ